MTCSTNPLQDYALDARIADDVDGALADRKRYVDRCTHRVDRISPPERGGDMTLFVIDILHSNDVCSAVFDNQVN